MTPSNLFLYLLYSLLSLLLLLFPSPSLSQTLDPQPYYRFQSTNYRVDFFRSNPTSPTTLYSLRTSGTTPNLLYRFNLNPPAGYIMSITRLSKLPCLEYQATVYVQSGQKIPTITIPYTKYSSAFVSTTSYPTLVFVVCIGRLNNEFLSPVK